MQLTHLLVAKAIYYIQEISMQALYFRLSTLDFTLSTIY